MALSSSFPTQRQIITFSSSLGPELQLSNGKGDSYDYFVCNT